VLAAQGYSSDTNSTLVVQTAHALEQFVFVSADGEYMHKVQLCLNYLRQACGTITDLLTERPSLWSLQKRLQENAIQQRDVFHRWVEERNILEREITQDMLVGNENVSARMDEDSYCHRCHSRRISAETKQMRKADEGATTIFRCLECQHTWRKSA
jgi:DNA-directed RNA polymerase subunit M/transcription elongation factor TFIIS